MQATLNTDCGNCLGKIRIGQTEWLNEKCHNSIVAVGISCDIHVHECNYNSLSILFACRPMPSDGGSLAFVLDVSKKETWIKQELLAITGFFLIEDWPLFTRGSSQTYQRAVVNGSTFSCTSVDRSKLKNSHTVQYEDAKGQIQFREIKRSGSEIAPSWSPMRLKI